MKHYTYVCQLVMSHKYLNQMFQLCSLLSDLRISTSVFRVHLDSLGNDPVGVINGLISD